VRLYSTNDVGILETVYLGRSCSGAAARFWGVAYK